MSRPSPSERVDVYQQLTDRIVAQIETGAGAFRLPWHKAGGMPLHMPENCDTKNRYRGMNVLSLWGTADERGYRSNVWGTYKQWQGRNAQVRKGEKGALVVVFKEWHVAPDPKDQTDDGKRLFARASWVFNAEQCDNVELPAAPDDRGPIQRLADVDAFLSSTGAVIRSGGNRAFYSPSTDHIQMPSDGLFFGENHERTEAWYSVALHELTHWSGAPKRLNREFGKRFGDQAYAFEELVAELGAAFLCASVGITQEPRTDHAQYLANWLKILKGDKRAIFTAASRASAAADYLAGLTDVSQKAAA